MQNPELQGVFGVVPTPFREDEEIDEEGLKSLVRHCRESGLHAAVILGSNGEAPYLTTREKLRALELAAEAADSEFPLVAGVSGTSLKESLLLAEAAKEAGYSALLCALILYFNLDFEQVKAFYTELAEKSGLPVIFYYFPEVTGLVLDPDQIAELAEIPGTHGAKITVINRSFIKRVIKLTRTSLWAVFAGSSFLMFDTLKAGGAGVICPLPLIAPGDCLELYQLMEKGKFDKAQEVQDKLLAAIPLFTGLDIPPAVGASFFKAKAMKPYGGPEQRPSNTAALLKEALRLKGLPITATVRAPNPALTREQAELVEKTLKDQGWI